MIDLFRLQGVIEVDTKDSKRSFKETEEAAKRLGLTFDQVAKRFRNSAGQFASSAELAAAGIKKTGNALDGLRGKVKSLEGIGASLSRSLTIPLSLAGAAAVKTATDMDSLRRGLTAVVGSSAEAEKQLVRLKEVAKLPGLGFKEAIQGSINLQAAGINANLAERSLKAFGNALATVGKGKSELDGVILALGQIQSKGKVSAEEINQLAERVPQIRQAIIKAFGTADTEVLQKAKITSGRFIDAVVRELEKLPKATGGAQNTFENLSDAAQQSMDKIGTSVLRIAVPALERLTPKIESVGQAFERLSPDAQNATLAIGGLAIIAGPVLSGLAKIGTAVSTLRGLMAGAAGIAAGYAAAIGGALIQTGGDQATVARSRQRDFEGASQRAREAASKRIGPRLADPLYQTPTGLLGPLSLPASTATVGATTSKPAINLAGIGGGAKSKGTRPKTEAEELAAQLKNVNAEIAYLSNQTSKEYKLRLQIEGADTKLKDLQELLSLRSELGPRGNLEQLRGLKAYNDFTGNENNRPKIEIRPSETVLEAIRIEEERAKKQKDILEKEARISDVLSDAVANLQDKIDNFGDPSAESAAKKQLRGLNVNFEDDRAKTLLSLARQADEQEKVRDAMDAAREASERFRDSLKDTFENVLDRLLRGDTKGAGSVLKNFGVGLASRGISGALFGGGGGGGFAPSGAGGGGGILGSLGSVFTGGFAGGPGGAAYAGGGSGGGGIRGFLGNLFGGGGGGGGILSAIGGLFGKSKGIAGLNFSGGGLFAQGAASVAGKAAGAGGFLSKLGGLFGLGGGAAGAGGGSGILAALGFSNPISAIITGGLIAAPFIMELFKKKPGKELRKLIKGEYGVDVKSASILDGIEKLGQSKFGVAFPKRLIETVRLPETRETVYEYAASLGLRGNSRLFSAAVLQDPFSAMNVQKRANGGAFAPGWLLVGERGPELMKVGGSGNVVPNHQLSATSSKLSQMSERGGPFAKLFRDLAAQIAQLVETQNAMLSDVSNTMGRLKPMRPGDVLTAAGPDAVTRQVEAGFRARTQSSEAIRNFVVKR